ncbi:MAG: 16S rRNA (guanine(527)-N(7))-methyltransferase RsmG [Christensenellales bacterium]
MKYLSDYFNQHGIDQSNIACFEQYFDMLVEWNEKFNLTAITDKEQVEQKHFVDSLLGAELIPKGSKICDVGSGAGFPSIPLAIIRPDCKFTLLDSLNKRINFLTSVQDALNLTNCICIHTRAEDYANNNREAFDVCVARAVAPLPTLLEYCIPLLKVGGKLIAYKGSNADEEISLSRRAMQVFNCKISQKVDTCLPNGDKRILVEIVKTGSTPKSYPRGKNKPRTNPII